MIRATSLVLLSVIALWCADPGDSFADTGAIRNRLGILRSRRKHMEQEAPSAVLKTTDPAVKPPRELADSNESDKFSDIHLGPVHISTDPIKVLTSPVPPVTVGNSGPTGAPAVLQALADARSKVISVQVDLAKSIAGDTGKVIAKAATAAEQHEIELTNTTSQNLINGHFPAPMSTALATAIRGAIREYEGDAAPIPAEVKERLKNLYPAGLLDKARYTVSDLQIALPTVINKSQNFMGNPEYAVTVGNIIVFSKPPEIAASSWWAHELKHVEQYKRWGIDEFADRYVTNSDAVEKEARDMESQVPR